LMDNNYFTRTCKKCKADKPLSEFTHARGRATWECKKCTVSRQHQWAKANYDRVSKSKAKWVDLHPDRRRSASRGWAQRNRERYPAYTANRVARGWKQRSHRNREIVDLYQKQNGVCANPYCRDSLLASFEIDHRMPLVLGGSDDISNLQLLCPRCNRAKARKHPDRWLLDETQFRRM